MSNSSSTKTPSAGTGDRNLVGTGTNQPYVTETPSKKVMVAANHDASSALMETINMESMLLNLETAHP